MPSLGHIGNTKVSPIKAHVLPTQLAPPTPSFIHSPTTLASRPSLRHGSARPREAQLPGQARLRIAKCAAHWPATAGPSSPAGASGHGARPSRGRVVCLRLPICTSFAPPGDVKCGPDSAARVAVGPRACGRLPLPLDAPSGPRDLVVNRKWPSEEFDVTMALWAGTRTLTNGTSGPGGVAVGLVS